MIKLIEVTEDNWFDIADLSVKDDQRSYVAPDSLNMICNLIQTNVEK